MKRRAAGLILALACVPALAEDGWCAPPRQLRQTAVEDFVGDHGHARFIIEAQHQEARLVSGSPGLLDIQTPAGLSLWWPELLQGDYELRFQARALPAPDSAGALAGRISDLNLFWNASEADGSPPQPRDGAFASYDSLRSYYMGFGANGNRTTRLRVYDGQGRRQILDGWADAPEAGPQDRRGAMTEATRLQPGRWRQVQIVSHAPRTTGGEHGQVRVDGRLLFSLNQAQPLLSGHFALRTTASRLQLRDFRIFHCRLP